MSHYSTSPRREPRYIDLAKIVSVNAWVYVVCDCVCVCVRLFKKQSRIVFVFYDPNCIIERIKIVDIYLMICK